MAGICTEEGRVFRTGEQVEWEECVEAVKEVGRGCEGLGMGEMGVGCILDSEMTLTLYDLGWHLTVLLPRPPSPPNTRQIPS